MKKLAIFVVVAGVLVIGGVILTIDTLARSAIEMGVEAGLGVPTKVGSVSLRPLLGSFRMNNLEIANPEGFEADHFLKLGRTETSVSYGALRQGDVVLERLELADMDLTLEWQGRKSNFSRMTCRNESASWPSGSRTAVIELEYSSGLRHWISRPQAWTAWRVASANRAWRANTCSSPSSNNMFSASSKPKSRLVAGV